MTEEAKNSPAAADGPATPLPGVRDVFATILESVTAGITSAGKGIALTGIPLQQAVAEVVKDSVRGAVAMGSDLVLGTKAIVLGILRATGLKDEAGLKILSHAAKTAIHHTADRGGNLAAATKGLVLGAIAAAKTMGVETARSATTAAQGAIEGAAEAGSVTMERVLAALKEPIGGARVAFVAPPLR